MTIGWKPRFVVERDAGGYRLEERGPSEEGALLFREPGGWYVVGNGGPTTRTTLCGAQPLVCLEFANVEAMRVDRRTAVLDLFNRYGPLGELQTTEVNQIAGWAWNVRAGLDMIREGKSSELGEGLAERKGAYSIGYEFIDGKMQLIVQAKSLMSFVYAQLAYLVAIEARIGICPQCYRYMLIKSTKRQWCSEACKKRAQRAK
jgi:hypothetical protein